MEASVRDLRARYNAQAEVDAPLRRDYEAAREKGRTGLTYNAWRDEELTQIALAQTGKSVGGNGSPVGRPRARHATRAGGSLAQVSESGLRRLVALATG